MKRYLPTWFKRPFRLLSDRLRREGGFFERRGRHDFIHQAVVTLGFNDIPGDYAEFGCCGVNTFGYAAAALRRSPWIPRTLWAFDSFAGLPPPEVAADEHPRWITDTMKVSLDEFRAACKRKRIRDYEVVPGFYKETLRDKPIEFLPPGRIALAYIDCDMYHSTVDVLKFLMPRLQHGMIMAFDDYWCYSMSDLSGERKAFREICQPSADWHFEPYLPFGWAGMSFVVESKRPSLAGG
jgi:O-methyltransferase